MKRFCFLCLILAALCACTSRTADVELSAIEAVMTEYPDSALSLLQDIDPRHLSRADNALYALLLSQAKDKCYIDETNDSLINIAVEYYSKTDNSQRLFYAYYYQGRIYQNANNYHYAVQSFSQAEQLVNICKDGKAKGMLYAQIGRLYTTYYDLPKALDAYLKSYDFYLQDNITTHIPHALLNIGNIYLNMKQYEEAAQYTSEAMKKFYANGDIVKCNESITLLSDIYINSNNNKAFEALLLSPYFNNYPHNISFCQTIARHFNTCGDFSKADKYMKQAWMLATSLNDSINLYYNEYKINKQRRDFASAFHWLDTLYSIEDSIVRVTLQQPLITTQRDYYQKQAEIKTLLYRNTQQRQLLFLMTTIIAALIIVVGILFVRQYIARKDAILAQQINTIYELQKSIINKAEIIDDMTIQTNKLFAHLYEQIENQCRIFYESQNSPQKEKYMYHQVCKNVKQICSDKDLLIQLEDIVNKYRENVMNLARKHIPQLNETDYQLLCFLYTGLSAKAISIFIGISTQNIYTRKSRIKSLIKLLPCEISSTMLKHLS